MESQEPDKLSHGEEKHLGWRIITTHDNQHECFRRTGGGGGGGGVGLVGWVGVGGGLYFKKKTELK